MAAKASIYTHLAESHTHPTGEEHKPLKRLPGLLKSGITPITPPPYDNYYKHKAHQDLKWYQAERFGGFTTQELHLHDAFAPYSQAKATGKLTCPIHPIIQRTKWRRKLPAQLARYPLGNGREGYWDAWENDTVWKLMVPALQLTTMFLANLYTWPWFDALFLGEMEEIDGIDLPAELRGKKGYRKFKLRAPYISANETERRRVQGMLERFRDDVTLDLSSGHTDTKSGLPDEFEFANTNGSLDVVTRKGIGISMAFEILEPLFNEKITEAERLIVLYRFAGTLLHELCVSFIGFCMHAYIDFERKIC
ncbi:e72514a3-7bc5-4884-b29d-2ee4915c82b5-CDS [Sclerotinia trifoliorum]|uniref:E72514a3-7bc5-4884-b29d-2ee4915c82b5-CDS n=1 Tax=Sclerotinia trifoliorum TaxID=28548 RepID=A0A8H2VRX8_9HELO|nr:e72514a3-7bc5-4884-b29d-2ee4915c82b5-CDS [Sclerotinia trifoliorum]